MYIHTYIYIYIYICIYSIREGEIRKRRHGAQLWKQNCSRLNKHTDDINNKQLTLRGIESMIIERIRTYSLCKNHGSLEQSTGRNDVPPTRSQNELKNPTIQQQRFNKQNIAAT